jgi:hypothetical protein
LASKLDQNAADLPAAKGREKHSLNIPPFDLRTEQYQITGIGWSQINGIDVLKMQTVIAEPVRN